MNKMSTGLSLMLGVFLASMPSGPSYSGEVKISSTTGMNAVMADIVAGFEKSSSHKVKLAAPAVAQEIAKRIQAGESYDVAIVTAALATELIKAGKATLGTDTVVARVAIGVAVKAGAPKPNIATADAFKSAVLNAKSVAYTRGLSGIHFEALLNRWAIAEQVKPKATIGGGGEAIPAVAKGDSELGIDIVPQIIFVPGVDLVGRLPEELQNYVVLAAVVSSASSETAGAKAFIDYLKSAPAIAVLNSKGMDSVK